MDPEYASDETPAATVSVAIHLSDIADDDLVIDGMNHDKSDHRSISFGTDAQDVTVFSTRDGLRTLVQRLSEKLDELDAEAGGQ